MGPREAIEAATNGDLVTLKSISELSKIRDQHGASCLHHAARADNISVIEFLIKNKTLDVFTRSNVGATAFHDAAASGNLQTVKWLINNTAIKVDDQDGTGASVLHLAARYGHSVMLDWLLNNTNCDTLLKTASGSIPLHFAVVGGDISCVRLLLDEAPRSVNIQLNNGVTAAYLACQEGQLEILQYLVIKAGANLKMNAYDGMTCLHSAAQLGRLNCVQWLIKEQAINPNLRDFDGATPLHFAASSGYYEAVDWLMKHGEAKVTLDNLGGSPLHNAVQMGHSKCVHVLLDNGCDPEITDNQGLSALELAINCRQNKCVDVLKESLVSPKEQVTPEKNESSQPTQPAALPPLKYLPPAVQTKNNQHPPIPPLPHRRSELFRPVSILSTVSTNSDFDTSEPQLSGKQHEVLAEVHTVCRNSQETGEKECHKKNRISLVLNSSVPSTSQAGIAHSNPTPHHLESQPSRPSCNGVGYSIGSDISSTESNLSSFNSGSDSDNRDSNNNQGKQRNSISRSYSQEFHSCEESGETIPSYDSKMDDNDDYTDQNGVTGATDQGMNRSIIRICKNNVEIDHIGADYNQSQVTHGEIIQSNALNSNIARISISEEKEPEKCESPPLPPPPSPPQSAHSSPVKTSANYPPPPPPPTLNDGSEITNSVVNESKQVNIVQNNNIPQKSLVMSSPFHQSNGPRPDIASEILRTGGSSSLKKSKPTKSGGGMNCVFSFGSDSKSTNEPKVNQKSLTGEFDPKKFLSDCPSIDPSGVEIPDWQRQHRAKKLAQKAMEDASVKEQIAEKEARFSNVPTWKRTMIEKREDEKRAKEEERMTRIKPGKIENIPKVDSEGNSLTPWQLEIHRKKNGFV